MADLRDDPGHDVDYFAWEVSRILKLADTVVNAGLGGEATAGAVADVRLESPQLTAFRNAVTHLEDNTYADDIAYMGAALRFFPDGHVDSVLDPLDYELNMSLGHLVETLEKVLSGISST